MTTLSEAATRRKPRRGALTRNRTLVGWSFILPNFIGFALFTLVPVITALVLAFMKWDAYNSPSWNGLANFKHMVHDQNFWVALKNTIFYALGHVPLTLTLALLLALLLNQKLRGIAFFRVAVFFPYITSLVAVAIVWNMMFNPTAGIVNQFLQFVGISDPPGWVASTTWALPAVIVTSVWRDMGYYMVLYLAGLQAIPQEYYEAAEMDGAGWWNKFWNITLPSLRPTTFLVLVLLSVQSFKVFDLIIVMTEGGPGRATTVLSQLIYQTGIVQSDFGYSSAIALVLFIIVLTVTIFQFKFQQIRER